MASAWTCLTLARSAVPFASALPHGFADAAVAVAVTFEASTGTLAVALAILVVKAATSSGVALSAVTAPESFFREASMSSFTSPW